MIEIKWKVWRKSKGKRRGRKKERDEGFGKWSTKIASGEAVFVDVRRRKEKVSASNSQLVPPGIYTFKINTIIQH